MIRLSCLVRLRKSNKYSFFVKKKMENERSLLTCQETKEAIPEDEYYLS